MDLKEKEKFTGRRHPWEISRTLFFKNLLKRRGLLHSPRILDIGAGDGHFLEKLSSWLPEKSKKYAIDFYAKDEEKNQIFFRREIPQEKFDLILLLDVLEHIENDENFLTTIYKENLKEKGYILLSVPQFSSLYSLHDKNLGHFRRYDREVLKKLFKKLKGESKEEGGIYLSLLLVRFLQKKWASRWVKDVGQWRSGKMVTTFLSTILFLEISFFSFFQRYLFTIPGLSYYILFQKVQEDQEGN